MDWKCEALWPRWMRCGRDFWLSHDPFEVLLSLLPIGHDPCEQREKSLSVIGFHNVAQLVGDHVIDGRGRCFYQAQIEQKPAGC